MQWRDVLLQDATVWPIPKTCRSWTWYLADFGHSKSNLSLGI